MSLFSKFSYGCSVFEVLKYGAFCSVSRFCYAWSTWHSFLVQVLYLNKTSIN